VSEISIRLRHGLVNLALLACATFVCLLVSEFGARLLMRDTTVLFPRNFTEAHYDGVTLRRLIPNSTFWHTSVDGSWEFRTNAQGFRDDENYDHQKPPDQRRVLILGDSQTQGFEVRQSATFAKQLEHRLRLSGMNAQVLNTGISGFGTAEELMFLQHEGMKYAPDAIVLAFFGNDFDDSVKSGLYELVNDKLAVRSTSYTPGVAPIMVMNAIPGAFWLSQHSYLFSIVVNTLWETAKEAWRVTAKKELTTEYAVRVSDISEYEKRLVVRLLQQMHAAAQAANIPFIIVEIPSPVSDGDPRAWQPSVPDDLVAVMTSSCDVYVPARAYLADTRKGGVFVPHGQRHINEQTHAKIAEVLDRILGETGGRFSTSAAYAGGAGAPH
jgi:lysophospholipase L1-like esterase